MIDAEKLTQLRLAVEVVRCELIEAEAVLADRRTDIEAFEFEYEATVGVLLMQLERVEAEVDDYLDRIKLRRNEKIFGTAFRSVEDQYRKTWQSPPSAPPPKKKAIVSENTEAQIKKLYRQLARRYHPDLAADEAERVYRTEMMTAVNDAYAARSLAELLALAKELKAKGQTEPSGKGVSEIGMIQALEEELTRCQRRLRQIDLDMQSLYTHHLVELSTEVKFGKQQGRDILAEMAEEVERQIARKTVERDMMKSQFDSLDSGNHLIR
ncbi:MAG: DnaJ domain-containing protein [Aquificales bacterium]|nr:DnaJ domain-containing protein [Aquificales bacterium]